MSTHGDITEIQEIMSKKLRDFEANELLLITDPSLKAKCLVCLAHDWYQIDCEEEGERLVLLAESVCPNYFKDVQPVQMKEDPAYSDVVKSLVREMMYIMMNRMSEVKK